MKIYVASSWRNEEQPALVERLRQAGHEVYDFKNPQGEGPGTGFGWQRLDPDWKNWTPEKYRTYLTHSVAQAGFESDERAMIRADACVLCLPAGRSAHLELGWMLGRGQLGYVLLSEKGFDPDLMYLLTPMSRICVNEEELFAAIAADEARMRNGELRPEYNPHTLRPVKHRWTGGGPVIPQNLPKDEYRGKMTNPGGSEVAIEGGICNLPVPDPVPLLLYVTTPKDGTWGAAAYSVTTKGEYASSGTVETLIDTLKKDGYVEIDPDLRSKLGCLEEIDRLASVFIHEARFKAAQEYGEQAKAQADVAFESIKHLLP